MKFKVMKGSHAAKDTTVYREGEVLECDDDLCAMFKNKFERVDDDTKVTEKTEEDKVVPGKKDKQQEAKEGEGPKDATSEFEGAADAGLKVMSENGWYQVYEEDDPDDPISDKKLRKKETQSLIKSFIESDEK